MTPPPVPTAQTMHTLAMMTTEEVAAFCTGKRSTILLPVGSVEPHGPHLPLATDAILSEEACARAVPKLAVFGIDARIAPTLPYGVTDYAAGFAGAIGVTAEALTAFLRTLVEKFIADGVAHVCIVNNHLEPAHDKAVRAAIRDLPLGRASVACPLTREWARTLSDEFKRGDCHAGRYETSLVLAANARVTQEALTLPKLGISLSDGIRSGKARFSDMGMHRAYTGAPSEATRQEGDLLYEKLVDMITGEVTRGLAAAGVKPGRPLPSASAGAALAGVAPVLSAPVSATPRPPTVSSPTLPSRAASAAPSAPSTSSKPRSKGRLMVARELRALPEGATKSFVKKDELGPALAAAVTQMMESQAYRELSAAQMFGFGLQFVPSLKWLKVMTWHIREKMEHYEVIARMYRELTGVPVEGIVNARLADQPIAFPASWYELAVAAFLYDRGSYWQLQEHDSCAFTPYRDIVVKILKEEAAHQGLGERIAVELSRGGKYDDVKQPLFEKWFKLGMLSFGRSNVPASRFAVEAGLKKRDPALVMQDFVNDIKPAVKASGLSFPTPKSLGLDIPVLDFDMSDTDASRAQGFNQPPDSMRDVR